MSPEPLELADEIRFIDRSDVQDGLALAHEQLQALNDDYHNLSIDMNPHSASDPYEQVTLFTIDSQPTNRASAIAQANAYGLEQDSRLDFSRQSIKNRRVILSQSALGAALDKNKPQYMTSYMNNNHEVWAHPLFVGQQQTAAIQLAFTRSEDSRWNLPSSNDVEKVFKKHKHSLGKVAKSLAMLSLDTRSLSKSLELQPPITPDSFMISWDVVNSSGDVLSSRYPTHERYLDAFKKRIQADVTTGYGATALDRGDGEHIIIPISGNLNDKDSIKLFGQQHINPLVDKLQATHDVVAKAYAKTISPTIALRVGVGNFEANVNDFLTSQAITETVKKARRRQGSSVAYTTEAGRILRTK
ncbi:MAG: hypothetical protein JWN28_661 [Candidatus Saccharibacteria bacterium]|nr:hypothetical protein [Candidatus Saccharibacteria bacterium]